MRDIRYLEGCIDEQYLSVPSSPAVALPELKLLIGNRWVASESGRTFATINPSTGEEICQVAEADAADVDKAVCAARAAFERGPWHTMPASQRGRLLYRLADLIEANAEHLARLESLDNGKTLFRGAGGGCGQDNRLLSLFRRLGRQGAGQDNPDRWRLPMLHTPRAHRRGRADHSMELSHADDGVEAGSSLGYGEYRCLQAGRANPAHRAAYRRADPGGGIPGRRGQCIAGIRPNGRCGHRPAHGCGQSGIHRLDRSRSSDHGGCREVT